MTERGPLPKRDNLRERHFRPTGLNLIFSFPFNTFDSWRTLQLTSEMQYRGFDACRFDCTQRSWLLSHDRPCFGTLVYCGG
jgi:hypothetical protein